MRRFARLGWLVTAASLGGCNGFPHFLGDTFGLQPNHNAPLGDSEVMRHAQAQATHVPPLRAATGDIWPPPEKPEPTLSDLQREQNTTAPATPGLATPPAAEIPGLGVAPALPATPAVPKPSVNARPKTFTTPGGPLNGTPVQGGGYQTLTTPGGGNGGIAIPNGNGTSTIIAPDGSVTTVPTPR